MLENNVSELLENLNLNDVSSSSCETDQNIYYKINQSRSISETVTKRKKTKKKKREEEEEETPGISDVVQGYRGLSTVRSWCSLL